MSVCPLSCCVAVCPWCLSAVSPAGSLCARGVSLGARCRSGAHFPNANRDSEVSRIDADSVALMHTLTHGSPRCIARPSHAQANSRTSVVDRMCCCNLFLNANGMATAMLRRVAWVPGACGRFFVGGKETSKQATLKRRQQGRSTAKRI